MVNGVVGLAAVPRAMSDISEQFSDTVQRQSSTIARSASVMASNSVAGHLVAKVSNAIESAKSNQHPQIKVTGGFLPGLTALSSPQAPQKCAPRRRVKVTIPPFQNQKLREGDQVPTFVVALCDGQRVGVKVPKGFKPGQQITIQVRDYTKMLTSTLQVPPSGAKIIVQKPIEWATARQPQEHNPDTGILLATAQHRLLKQAHVAGCNAVLGISFNVENKTLGQGKGEMVVTAFGTPCIVVPDTGVEGEQMNSEGKSPKEDDLESNASFADTATETDTEGFEP